MLVYYNDNFKTNSQIRKEFEKKIKFASNYEIEIGKFYGESEYFSDGKAITIRIFLWVNEELKQIEDVLELASQDISEISKMSYDNTKQPKKFKDKFRKTVYYFKKYFENVNYDDWVQ